MNTQLATVKTIRLNKDEQARANKAKESETRLARKTFIANAEASAKAFEKAFAQLRAINQQGATLYQSFKEIVDASRESLIAVRQFFAHKKKGELLSGEYATGDDWAQARCGVRYDYVCRCLNLPKEQPLLRAVNETAQSPVSQKPHVVNVQELLKDTPKAVRERIAKKIDREIADAKKASTVEMNEALAKQAAEAKSALAKQAADLHAKIEQQRQRDTQEARRQQQLAVQRAVDATQANALRLVDKLPTKTTTALEANALDESILILRGIVFTVNKSSFPEKKYFTQAVAFLKAHNAFQALSTSTNTKGELL